MYLNIVKECRENNTYKKVLLKELPAKVTVMSLKPQEDIPEETHDGVQVFLLIQGWLRVDIEGKGSFELFPGDSVSIPADTKHYVINPSNSNHAKLISFYSLNSDY
jgi:quercetin dioxygenase-like cupin family protein